MNIFLMRHGLAMSGLDHPFEPLSETGRKGVEATARFITSRLLSFDLIVSSTKLRAEETAEIVARETGYPLGDIIKTDDLKPNAATEDTLAFLEPYADRASILVTGHMPSLPSLAARLIGAQVRIPFPNACLYQVSISSPSATDGDIVLLYTPGE